MSAQQAEHDGNIALSADPSALVNQRCGQSRLNAKCYDVTQSANGKTGLLRSQTGALEANSACFRCYRDHSDVAGSLLHLHGAAQRTAARSFTADRKAPIPLLERKRKRKGAREAPGRNSRACWASPPLSQSAVTDCVQCPGRSSRCLLCFLGRRQFFIVA